VVVPELVAQLRAAVGEPNSVHVHFGATSQDVIDSSLSIRLVRALAILAGRLDGIIETLNDLEARQGRSR
jgi:3-carboxy-cis,cis-muconate cycloisomerase